MSSAVLTLIHLAFWAQLGVLTRVFLDKFFQLGCEGGWGPCLQGGIYFKDLPSNMLGSFVIGVFAPSSTIDLDNQKAMALLPTGHPWQANFALQIGIRTGYCGSLTTFSGWVLEFMIGAIHYNAWVNLILGLIVGLYAALASYIVGTHVALYIDRWLLAEAADVLIEQERFREQEVQMYRLTPPEAEAALRRLSVTSPQRMALEEAEPDIPRLTSWRSDSVAPDQIIPPPTQQAASDGVGATSDKGDASIIGADGKTTLKPKSLIRLNLTDVMVCIGLACLTAGAAAGVGVETRHEWLRVAWLSLLMAPPGCFMRWWFSFLNYKLSGPWGWAPYGTFAVNMLGTAVTCGLQAATQRAALGYWAALAISALQIGFCGALTTVSTFVTEIIKFSDVFPDAIHAYVYSAGSLLGAIMLAITLYGWSIWAP